MYVYVLHLNEDSGFILIDGIWKFSNYYKISASFAIGYRKRNMLWEGRMLGCIFRCSYYIDDVAYSCYNWYWSESIHELISLYIPPPLSISKLLIIQKKQNNMIWKNYWLYIHHDITELYYRQQKYNVASITHILKGVTNSIP